MILHKRRRKKKTNYKKRIALIKSGKTRLVIRKSLKNISVQFVKFKQAGDVTVACANSKELKKFGWAINCGNIPAAYLTGLLAGLRFGKQDAILDIGMQTSVKGSRVYAALAGVLDAGAKVCHSKDILPTKERLTGEHIVAFASKLEEDKIFSRYKISPKELTKHFEEVKQAILKSRK